MNEEICTECGESFAMHIMYKNGVREAKCCVCYIKEGAPHAEWHPECMEHQEPVFDN